MPEQALLLDSSIRDWVLFPILAVMVLVGLLRTNVANLISGPPKKMKREQLREQRILARSATLRANYVHLDPRSFAARKEALIRVLDDGSYVVKKKEEEEKKNPAEPEMPKNPLSDPESMEVMMDGMKKQAVMMVPQTAMMWWINSAFAGFVLLKLPFPLTLRFKQMLQRGIDTPDMDSTWVSSLSWFFLLSFGLGPIFRLLGQDEAADGFRDMAAMNMGGVGLGGAGGAPSNPLNPNAGPDYAKLHKQEVESLEVAGLESTNPYGSILGDSDHPSANNGSKATWLGDNVEQRVLSLYERHRTA